jgi:hypothetical protein
MIRFAPGLLVLALDIFCLIDVITSDENRVRNLPKVAWFLLILLVPFIGSVVWLAAGRPEGQAAGRSPYQRPASGFPEYDRPGRAAGLTPESDEEFLRRVRERAEAQRRKAAEDKLRREAAEEGPDGTET